MQVLRVLKPSKQELYERHTRYAYLHAHKFAQAYNRPLEDMIDEGLHALGLAVAEWDKYDRGKASPSTYLYKRIKYHFLEVCRPPRRKTKTTTAPNEKLDKNPSRQSWYSRIWGEVGDEGRAPPGS